MLLRATCFRCVVCSCGRATPKIHRAGYGLKVPGIDARPISAEVVEIQSGGDVGDEVLKECTVGHMRDSRDAQLTVPIAGLGADPLPALTGWPDVLCEPLIDADWHRPHGTHSRRPGGAIMIGHYRISLSEIRSRPGACSRRSPGSFNGVILSHSAPKPPSAPGFSRGCPLPHADLPDLRK